MQIDPVFSNQRFATSRRTDTLPLQRCRQCYQSTEHTCPPTYPKHVRIGSCTKKLEDIFDVSFFWQNTVLLELPVFGQVDYIRLEKLLPAVLKPTVARMGSMINPSVPLRNFLRYAPASPHTAVFPKWRGLKLVGMNFYS